MKKEKEVNKKINVRDVFQIIFIIISIIIGLFSLVFVAMFLFVPKYNGSYIWAVLYIFLTLFAFLPKKITRVPYWARALIVFVGFFVIIIIAGLFNLNLPATTSINIINHNMNESFILDLGTSNVSMIVYNLTENTSFNGETTEGYFLIVNCEITNLGKDTISLNMSGQWYDLTDNQNKTYMGSSNLGSQEYFEPNLGKQFYFLFEIPKTAQGIKLNLGDKIGVHVVDLKI